MNVYKKINILRHMLRGIEAIGQKLPQIHRLICSARADHVDHEFLIAEFPHDLPANAAGWKGAGDHTVLAAADGNGGKIPVSVVDCLKKGGALRAVCRAVCRVFNVASLIHRPIRAQKRRPDLIAGIWYIGMLHSLKGQLA